MIAPSPLEIEELWKDGNHKEVARWLPYYKHDKHSPLIENLKESKLSELGTKLDLPPITLGSDPEFILCEKGNPDKIVMFSSKYTGNKFGISEAAVGADYGLLEFRMPPVVAPRDLARSIQELHKDFEDSFTGLEIIKKEAIVYNHEMARIKGDLEAKQLGQEIPSYGGYHGKDCSVWSDSGQGNIVLDETSNMSLSAYGKPEFKKYRPDILSAGGHIHIGGTFIKCLSLNQLNNLIRQFDNEVLPLVEKAETEAAKLRKEVYGAPGEYRLKEYGIEYRSPSNVLFFKENENLLIEVLLLITRKVKNFMLEEIK